ncbi:MAG: DsbA family protein [Paracoccaceae bacterium]|jgi:protein-disulfide isomerase|nr:DsbA family protein [Paracoccaceae bacterium]
MKIATFLFLIFYLFIGSLCKADLFSNISDSDRLALQKEIRTYLLNNPEVIIEAVKNLESKNQKDNHRTDNSLIQENYDELFNDGISWQGGNLNGDITIIEFLDYRCGYCRKAHKDITKLLEVDKNIKFIIKEYPILGTESVLIARVTIAVLQLYNKNIYKRIHNKLMNDYINPTEQNIKRFLEENKLDSSLVLRHINSESVTNHLRKIRQQGERLSITGTPTFVIEGNMVRGYLSYKQLQEIINEIR